MPERVVAEIQEPSARPALEALLASIEAEMAEAPIDIIRRAQEKLGKRYVTISLGDRRFAPPFDAIVGADHVPPITFVPGLPAYVRGVSNVRSEIVPMIDLGRLLEADKGQVPARRRVPVGSPPGGHPTRTPDFPVIWGRR